MNRTIFRTSLFWLLLFAVVAAVYVYRTRATVHSTSSSAPAGVQPIASGPMEDTSKDASSMPATKMEAPRPRPQPEPHHGTRLLEVGARNRAAMAHSPRPRTRPALAGRHRPP